jgi:hypothetical protein
MNENFGEQPEHACGGRHVAPTQRGSRESQGRVAVAARGPRERGRACTRGVKVRLRGTTLQARSAGPRFRPLPRNSHVHVRIQQVVQRGALWGAEPQVPPIAPLPWRGERSDTPHPGGLEPGKGPEWAGSKGGGR